MELDAFLRELGMTQYERSAIIALAGAGALTATELVRASRVPQGRIYSVVQRLSEEGIVQVAPGRPKRYIIPDVRKALAEHLEKRRASLEGQRQQVAALSIPLRSAQPPPTVRALTGREAHLRAIAELYDSAQRSVVQVSPLFVGSAQTRQARARAAGRGVRVRVIIRGVTRQNRAAMAQAVAAGVRVRQLESDDMPSMLLADDRFLLGLQDYRRGEERLTVLASNAALHAVLQETFERLWRQARPVRKKGI